MGIIKVKFEKTSSKMQKTAGMRSSLSPKKGVKPKYQSLQPVELIGTVLRRL